MDNESVLTVSGLTKQYGSIRAIDAVSFSVKRGTVIGLLGPNGAGKTTTINMVLGILEPTRGSIEVFGKNLKEHRSAISKNINFVAV